MNHRWRHAEEEAWGGTAALEMIRAHDMLSLPMLIVSITD